MEFKTVRVADLSGNVMKNADVRVYRANTTTEVTVFDENGVTLTTAQLKTDANGAFGFKTFNGVYDIVASLGSTTATVQNVQFNDPPAYTTVAAFFADIDAGYTAPDGTVVSAGPVQFQADSTANVTGLRPGWVPFGEWASPHHFDTLTNAIQSGYPLDWGSDTYSQTTAIAATVKGPIRWKGDGAKLVYTGSLATTPFIAVTAAMATENKIVGLEVDANGAAREALSILAPSVPADDPDDWPSITLRDCAGRGGYMNVDLDLFVSGLVCAGGWKSVAYDNCVAADCFLGAAVTFASTRSAGGIRTSFHPTNFLVPRRVSVSDCVVERVWAVGKIGTEQEADAVSIFQAPGIGEPSDNACSVRNLTTRAIGCRSLKLHSAERAIVDGVHITNRASELPFSGEMRTTHIDAQQSGAIITNVDALFDGVWPPFLVGNYTEQDDHARTGAITENLNVFFTAATAGETTLVYMRNNNLTVDSDTKSIISGAVCVGQIKAVALIGARLVGQGRVAIDNIIANTTEAWLQTLSTTSDATLDVIATNCFQTGAARALYGAASGGSIDPDWKLTAIGCRNFTDVEFIHMAAGDELAILGSAGVNRIGRAVTAGGLKFSASSGTDVATLFDIDAPDITSSTFTMRLGRATNTSGRGAFIVYAMDGSGTEAARADNEIGLRASVGAVTVPTYSVATLPAASSLPSGTVYVSDGAAGSPVLAFSNGANWLRCDTLAVVSAT